MPPGVLLRWPAAAFTFSALLPPVAAGLYVTKRAAAYLRKIAQLHEDLVAGMKKVLSGDLPCCSACGCLR